MRITLGSCGKIFHFSQKAQKAQIRMIRQIRVIRVRSPQMFNFEHESYESNEFLFVLFV